ncbi:hypothetical protein LARV_00991 [Longilinea arvoryzae]|uniref:Uncharacterized protein n=1 Tax=Longilinea arvoryzae TaxID=360412 RepID=A0A0S7BGF8_9CHLR|nr:ATP-binding protein [Longilinea arvoryzae]GAP13240.1 hypothetical protein LARV_00991 [Longilinea arvoryzae]
MTNADYRGARAANAGDDYHELWALRQSLSLLDAESGLYAIAVEGLKIADESGKLPDTWDGVDCTFYYGDSKTETPTRIVIAQFKYSSANPNQSWSISRLTRSTKKRGDNSIIRKLANAFIGLKEKYPHLAGSDNLIVQLISNQPMDEEINPATSESIASRPDQNKRRKSSSELGHARLQKASGLNGTDFLLFMKALDFSLCGSGSRFSLEENVFSTISNWKDEDSRTTVEHLLRSIRRKMMPEAKGEVITRQVILSWMDISDQDVLFPCSSEIKNIFPLVNRKASEIIATEIISGKHYICIHGEGGCGKSTLIQEITERLPSQSILITFDCYGGGRYLDADAFRHRPQDAFLQLINDLAVSLRIPLLLSRSPSIDYPRVFKKRLERASEIVASYDEGARLVIVIDAADNSIIAAQSQPTPEKSFIYDFVTLGDLPVNVCFIVTTRSGRLDSLRLPDNFMTYKLDGFDSDETAAHIRLFWIDASDAWIDDFHYLSGGNPRVQRYAIDYSTSDQQKALSVLRPKGKNLEGLFKEQLITAHRKSGQDLKIFCSGIIALPRPIPIKHLSPILGLNEYQVRDICADLAPGIIVDKDVIRFADEDFESFLRSEAGQDIRLIYGRIADHFSNLYREDSYAASHIASSLLAANQRQSILDLIDQEQEPTVISDPILRREVQSQRLRIAMKVCRETNNNADAILTLLYGAEALKTDAVIQKMLIENPDLAANFARDRSSRLILGNADEYENHGRLLFQLLAHDARNNDGISVREGLRQLRAWMQRRSDHYDEQEKTYPNINPQGWPIEYQDIAAEIEAVLRIEGPKQAIRQLFNWSPRSIALRVAISLSFQLITSGEADLVERCLNETNIHAPWDLFLLIPLALSGKDIDLERVKNDLEIFLFRGLIKVDKLKNTWDDGNVTVDYLELILTACEVFLAHGGEGSKIIPVLEKFNDNELRRHDQLFTSRAAIIDLTLRAFTILERLNNRTPTIATYLIDPQEQPNVLSQKEVIQKKKPNIENKQKLEKFIGPQLGIYDVRAQAIIGIIPSEGLAVALKEAITKFHQSDYQFSRDFHALPMKSRIGISISRLLALPKANGGELLENILALLGSNPSSSGKEFIKIFQNLAVDRSLHSRLLTEVVSQYQRVKDQRSSAEDKIEAFSNFARFLLPISQDDAEVIFKDAFRVAGEVNIDVIHEISIFKPFSHRAIDKMAAEGRRHVAKDFAVIVCDAGVRLDGYDHFPWKDAAQAIATLDFPFSLAITARWDDENIAHKESLLPAILEAALSLNTVSPTQVSSLSPLLDEIDEELICQVIDKQGNGKDKQNNNVFTENIARDELLWFGRGTRSKFVDKLISVPEQGGNNFWKAQLIKATEFHQKEKPKLHDLDNGLESLEGNGKKDPLADVDFSDHRFTSEEELSYVIAKIYEEARIQGIYVPTNKILERIHTVVQLKDRKAYLDVLSKLDFRYLSGYELGHEISRCVENWSGSPAVSSWCNNRLLQIVIERLPYFCSWPDYDKSFLSEMLSKTDLPDSQICTGLLDALERHVDVLKAPTIYALVGIIGQYCSPQEAAQVISRYASRLIKRIPMSDQENWNIGDIPINHASAFARFLYALLGDFDARIRWRAAHAIRRMAQSGNLEIIDELVHLFNRTDEASFRDPNAPFYWLAAQLWLVITFERIASETPSAISKHGLWLLEIATNDDFPHVLLRSFAKSAVLKLIKSGYIEIDLSQRNALDRANTSPIPRRKGRDSYKVGFDKYSRQEKKDRKFRFDSMDTLPYWYTSAIRIFANVDGEEFLDIAESWIVDHWNVKSNPWRWDDEPRKRHRGDESSYYMTHDHGSRPIIERYHTYLEWHAMWCAIGELMKFRALTKESKDDSYCYELLVNEEGLAMPELWLADILAPKPLETQLWREPQKSLDRWLDAVDDKEFLTELGLNDDVGFIVVNGYHETKSYNFQSTVHVNSALVSPKTAAALVRSLQTIESSWDYRIPPAGDELEIKTDPYTLIGWLTSQEQGLGIEETDPLRYEIRRIESEPSERTRKELNISMVYDKQVNWVQNGNGKRIFIYEPWGDDLSGERAYSRRYDQNIRSNGWRLSIDREALKAFLAKSGFDLIIEIEITRSNKGDDYSRYDEEKTKESQFDRVLLFRADGTIEAAEGSIGTWTLPGS